MKKNDFLRKVYSEIKKDNLEQFKKYISQPKTIYIKNKQNENFLFYSLQSGSFKISQFIIENHPEFLLEKNSFLLTPFSDLIYRDNKKGFNAFFKLCKTHEIALEKLFEKGGEIYTIPLLAVEKLTKDNWEIFENLTKKLWKEKHLNVVDKFGYNIAHKIAINNSYFATSILDYLPSHLFKQLDKEIGASPFLNSLKFSDLSLVKQYLNYSDIYQKTTLGSNAVHLSIFNSDIKVLEFVLDNLKDNISFITQSNHYGDSPLMSAINNHNMEALTLLVPYHIEQGKDLSKELINFIKISPKNFDKFKLFLKNIEPENIKELLNNEEYLTVFFAYIFQYSNYIEIQDFQKNFFWDKLHNIQDKFLNHQIYSSAILGKKAIKYKISYLLNQKEILNSKESNNFFIPKKEIDLYFNNEDYIQFSKNTKISSFVSLLNTMPGNQIIELINQTSVMWELDNLDKIHLFCIALKNKNEELINSINFSDVEFDIKLIEDTNCALMIQELLKDYQPDIKFKKHFNFFLSKLDFTPTILFHNYIDKIFLSEKKEKLNIIQDVLVLFDDFLEYKKDFIHLLIYRLTQSTDEQDQLFNLFKKKESSLISAIDNMSSKNINKIKNNDFTKYILCIYGSNKNPLNLLVKLAQSENIFKHDLMNIILHQCILNENTTKKMIEQIKQKKMDQYSWSFFVKNFNQNKNFPLLLDYYFLSNKIFEDFSSNLIEDIPFISECNKESIYNTLINYKGTTKEEIILNTLTAKFKLDYSKIIDISLKNNSFHSISYLIKHKNIDINNLNVELVLESYNRTNIFIDFKADFIIKINEKLNNYFYFLKEHKEVLNNKKITSLFKVFYQWLEKNETKEIGSEVIKTINTFLNIFEEKIKIIPNENLIDICKIVLLNNDLKNRQLYLKEYNNIFNTIFLNKEYEEIFFKEINEDIFFIDNMEKIPLEQQKRLQFYSLKNKFIPNSLKEKKIIKI